MESEERKWSIVMTGSRVPRSHGEQADKDLRKFVQSVPDVFQFALFDLYLLAKGPPEGFSAEVKDGLSRSEAEELVGQLETAGVEALAVPTDEVQSVCYRVRDLLPDYCSEADDFVLSAADGLVVMGTPMMAVNWARNWRSGHPETPKWQIENYHNHDHFFVDEDPEWQKDADEYVEMLKRVLARVYPDRRFTIHRDSITVSFWQTTPDSPRVAKEGEELIFIEPAGEATTE